MSASTVTPRSTTTRGSRTVRRHELDWLRTAAVFGLIPFHTAIIFTTGSYDYVKNAQTSAFMDLLTSFVSIWGILAALPGRGRRVTLRAGLTRRWPIPQ